MSSSPKKLLWVDDEIDLLESHILYLGERGYEVTKATNGQDALTMLEDRTFDLVLIDEMMPAMNGLEVLRQLKERHPDIPAVMVTKNEAEELMDQAIGSHIDGYLTKPVNPSQILSVLKSIIERRQISQDQLPRRWAEGFAGISRLISEDLNASGWIDLHSRMCSWELELDRLGNNELIDMLQDIRREADGNFNRWIEYNYPQWISNPEDRPMLSMDVANRSLINLLTGDTPVLFLVLDCLRYDQWLVLEPLLSQYFDIKREGYLSALPSATPYSRNAIFGGLNPAELERVFPEIWNEGDENEAMTNRFERQLLEKLLERRGVQLKSEMKYIKVLENDEAAEFERRVNEYLSTPLTAMVYNFVDILLHTRQSVEVLREMLPDEAAFRSVTQAWFKHSSLFRIMRAYGEAGGKVLVTSDHGSIRARRGAKVIGDRQTSSSLRYKIGRNLQIDKKHAVRIKEPSKWGLPERGVNTEYVIARDDYYLVYPTNYHKYLEMYKDSFQHGGISLEEMVLPLVTMTGKGRV